MMTNAGKIFIIAVSLLLLLNIAPALAHGDAIAEGKELVESKASCDALTDEQLEEIGEYEMELMHPGQSHEAMHQMMGFKEGDSAEEKFHINLAKTMYCEEGGDMMNSGSMKMSMMGGQNMQGSMMGGLSQGFNHWSLNVIYLILLIGLIILVYVGIYKLWLWEPKYKKENKED